MIEILDPTTEALTQTIEYAPRPTALSGKRVALIQNTKFNSDKLLAKIGDILKAEHGVAEWKMYHKHNSSVPGARRDHRRGEEVGGRHGRRHR